MSSNRKPVLDENLLDSDVLPSDPYIPRWWDRWQLIYTYRSEKFYKQLCREFKQRTGSWPVLSMSFHYGGWLWMISWFAAGAFYRYESEFWMFFGIGIVGSFAFWLLGENWAFLRAWRRFRFLNK